MASGSDEQSNDQIQVPPNSAAVRRAIALGIAVAVAMIVPYIMMLMVVNTSHDDACRAINQNRQFVADLDNFIVAHTPPNKQNSPEFRSFRDFLSNESKGSC